MGVHMTHHLIGNLARLNLDLLIKVLLLEKQLNLIRD